MNKIKLLFLIVSSRRNKLHRSSVKCRITLNSKRKEFSTGLFINPDCWNAKKQKVEPSEDSTYVNQQLSLVKNNLYQAFLFLQVSGESFTVEDVYSRYKGETTTNEKQVLETYREYLARIERLIGKDLQLVTYKKYQESYKHLADFIKWKHKRQDIQIKSLKEAFLDDYSYFLKTEKNMAQSTLNKAIQRFRKVVNYAISADYLSKDPFLLFKYKTVRKEVIFLTVDELQKLENHHFQIARIEKVKDLFIFCCYTGLAYKEMALLKKEDVVIEFDDNLWLKIHRSKTKKAYKIPLLPKALEIIDNYKDEDEVLVFKNISNQRFNGYLKEIADVVGITKKLTHHMARKTFASTVLLYNNVPMEIVSALLGHSSIRTTEASYGKIVQRSISKEINRIKNINQ
ncbi:site-specific integrase [Aureitalea sp. L0-47]|uniref:site-specific integrase n=1 Tax=Aureitalea sp. L0-47 TaxID=2816962 RepID=UPI002237997A|nr:site-specific integrase [Aureitalea sp. L0-47]MCW5518481.1 site-specific integrase [Aureitalea sp. L0-47]